MAVNTDGTTGDNIKYSQQHIENMSYDEKMGLAARLLYGYDRLNNGTRRVEVNAEGQLLSAVPDLAVKVTTVGTVTYIGLAIPGSSESDAVWQAFKYDNGRLIYADGDGEFNNVATDLTILNFI